MSLDALLSRALASRSRDLEQWHSEGSDCYRLFHGEEEGFPSLAIDRYGPVLLVQTWKAPLEPGELDELTRVCNETLGTALAPCWNHLSRPIDLPRWHKPRLPERCLGRELDLRFEVPPRHPGSEPLLSLVRRAGRRWMAQNASGCSVLNLFAHTCSTGIVAAARGASEVWNVDSDATAIEWGKKNATLNHMGRARIRWLQSDCIPALRQLANQGIRLRDGKKIEFPKLEPRQFDRVILDPPRIHRGPFGNYDLASDYSVFFKPALLCVRHTGRMLVTNCAAEVSREDWLRELIQCAESVHRSVDFQVLHPESDFPGPFPRPALKMAILEVRD